MNLFLHHVFGYQMSFDLHEIIDKVKSGDQRSFGQLYDHFSPSVFGIILKMTNNQELAEEIAHDVFVKIWKNIKKYDSERSKFFTWLYKITRNTTLNALDRKSEKMNRSVDYGNELNFEPSMRLNIDTMDIDGGLKKIDPKYSIAISTVYLAGYTQQEASDKLGIPLGTVKTRIRLGLNELKKYYGLPLICILGMMSLIKFIAIYG